MTTTSERPVGEWKLVPVEPLPEMIGAWYRVKNGHHFHDEAPPTDNSDYAAYRAMLASAPASPAIGVQAVKALEWVDNEASSPVGHYRVQRLDSKWEPLRDGYYMLPRLHGIVRAFDTPEDARAHCQADYEQRILSALHPAPEAPSPAAAGEERRDEIAKIIDPHSFIDIPFTDEEVLLDMVEQSKQDALRKADRILATLSDTAPSPKGVSLPADPNWYARMAALEGDYEIGAGRRTATINLTPEEIAEYERLALATLPEWARKEIEAARSAQRSDGDAGHAHRPPRRPDEPGELGDG